jgi:predicted Zn-dependent protease
VKRTWILLFSVLCLVLSGCADLNSGPKKRDAQAEWGQVKGRIKLQLARRSLDQGQLKEALQQCTEAISLDPESLDGHLLMAEITLEKGNDAQAEAALRHAALVDEKHPDISYLGGILAERRNKPDEAVALYQKAYTAKPDDLDYLLSYAVALLHAGRPERALPLLKSRQKDFPDEPSVQLLIGQALSLMDRKEEAAAVLQEAVRLAPDNSLVRQEAGLTLLRADKIDQALEVLGPLFVASTDKCSPAMIRAAAGALLAHNRPDRAVRILEPATVTHAQDASLWLLLGRAYLLTSRTQEAVRAAGRAVQIDEASAEARLLLAYASLEAGQRLQAAQVARQVLDRDPQDHEAAAILARTR